MKFVLATPERIIYDEINAAKVVIPTEDGQITVLPGHIPLISSLGRGEVIIGFSEKDDEYAFVIGGVVQVYNDEVTLLANLAEKASEINEAAIEESIRRAKEDAEKVTEDIDIAEVQAKLANDIARLKLASKYKNKRPHITP
jgi:F-type H+-transporting ATPase subunit epsilon